MQFVCLLQNGIRSHCSEFILTPPVDRIITLRVHFDLIYYCWVYIKLLIQNYILVKIIIFIDYLQYHIHVLLLFQQDNDTDELDEDERGALIRKVTYTYVLFI